MPTPCRTGCGHNAILKVSFDDIPACFSFYFLSSVFLCVLFFFFQRPKTGNALCKECFFWAFETEVHHTVTKGKLFKRGDSVAIAASGGKDSTVLAYILKLLNEKYNYGLKLMLLSIDEGITGALTFHKDSELIRF